MLRVLTINLIVALGPMAAVGAAPPVDVELVTERGVQITAPQQWLQLLAEIGVEQVRIRGIQASDELRAENRGTPEQPAYHVVGILTTREQLRLPGGTFTRSDRAKLKDYFAQLAADGAESLTAPRGPFGLTEKQLAAVFADLQKSIDFETKGQPAQALVDRLQAKLSQKLVLDGASEQALREGPPVGDELKGLSIGTGLAILLRDYGLAMRPEKWRGEPVVYRVEALDSEALAVSTLGKTSSAAPDSRYWPIGWESDKNPGELAPSLRESLSAEIDGYSLAEALAAIEPRLKLPMYVDHAALAAHQIEPAKVQVKLARARLSYRRLLDRVLAQAHLGSSLRIDDSGQPFIWVTR